MNTPIFAKIGLGLAILLLFAAASLFGSPVARYTAENSANTPETTAVDSIPDAAIPNTPKIATATPDTSPIQTPKSPETEATQQQNDPENELEADQMVENTPDAQEKPRETPEQSSQPVAQEKIDPDFSQINTNTRAALINIICTVTGGSVLQPITGSGVIVGEKGVVLTNAHVAQYFLLADYPDEGAINCRLRAGSPAKAAYEAELLYISPSWITANAQKITDAAPTGTGQYDYALLRITRTLDKNAPGGATTPFKAIPLETETAELDADASVLVAGYSAGLIDGLTIYKDLYASSSVVPIADLYTFIQNTVDLISLGGSVVAQKGASGGAVVNGNGDLVGIVVTSTQATQTADRDLRAITVNHVDTTLRAEAGRGLAAFISGDIVAHADNFNTFVAPQLRSQLLDAITAE